MTLQEFSRDAVPIIQTVLGLAGIASLGLVWLQIRQASAWNKLQHAQTYLDRPANEVRAKLEAEARRLGVELSLRLEPLSAAEARLLMSDTDALLAARAYLNAFEGKCAAIRIGMVDSDLAFATNCSSVINAWHLFSPLIELLQDHYSSKELMVELCELSATWRERRANLRERIEKEREKQERDRNRALGTRAKAL